MNAKLFILAGVVAFSFNCANATNIQLEPRAISVEDCSSAKTDDLYVKILTQLAWISLEDIWFYDPCWTLTDERTEFIKSQLFDTVNILLDSVNEQSPYEMLKNNENQFYYALNRKSEPDYILNEFSENITNEDIVKFLGNTQKVLSSLNRELANASNDDIRASINKCISRVNALIKLLTSDDIHESAKAFTPALIFLGERTLLAAGAFNSVDELYEVLERN